VGAGNLITQRAEWGQADLDSIIQVTSPLFLLAFQKLNTNKDFGCQN